MTLRQIVEHESFLEVTQIDIDGGALVGTGHNVDVRYDRTTQKITDCLIVYLPTESVDFPLDQEIVWEENKVSVISRYNIRHTLSFSKQISIGEDKFV